MIESFKDLNLSKEDTDEQINVKVKELMGISLDDMILSLSEHVIKESSEIATGFMNIAPLGDYGKFTEDPVKISEFLKIEAHKPEHWKLSEVKAETGEGGVQFKFVNDSIDDGHNFEGMVYVSFNGKIKHVFAQSCE